MKTKYNMTDKKKKIKIWDIQNLGETLEDIMEGQLLIIKYIKSLTNQK